METAGYFKKGFEDSMTVRHSHSMKDNVKSN